MDKLSIVNEVIQNRKSVYAVNYINKEISKIDIEQMLENANRAPSHKFTEPWRFKVISGDKRAELGHALVDAYEKLIPAHEQKESKKHSMLTKPMSAGAIIAICMQRDQEERIPEWEEVASTAMAVQNIYLTCTAMNIGCYWSSPKIISHLNDFLQLSDGEKCLGLLYMGHYERELPVSRREPIADKTTWM